MPATTAAASSFELSSGPGYLELKLQDGSVLHVHPIVMDIHKSSKVDEHGKPVYLVTGGLAVRVMPSEVEST
ncbi:MAG: hypothetical protein FWD69_06495 [Polyangiaceae bacterium]|nr:hypothetical protein [Polyangiaceae bacterium]